jgi:hypothetical protein
MFDPLSLMEADLSEHRRKEALTPPERLSHNFISVPMQVAMLLWVMNLNEVL